jgi:hypothetical protein
MKNIECMKKIFQDSNPFSQDYLVYTTQFRKKGMSIRTLNENQNFKHSSN